MNFNETPEFLREFKRLRRKYKSLSEDMGNFRKAAATEPLSPSKHAHVLNETGRLQIIKARFACQYLKGASMRIIYAYIPEERRIEFIEIYFKGDRENEDRKRIRRYLAASAG